MTETLDPRLLGKWRTVPGDVNALSDFGDVTLEFSEGGFLVYTIHGGTVDQEILLRYRTEGDNVLVTDQPSAPREERTVYEITRDGRLRLAYAGTLSTYRRVTE